MILIRLLIFSSLTSFATNVFGLLNGLMSSELSGQVATVTFFAQKIIFKLSPSDKDLKFAQKYFFHQRGTISLYEELTFSQQHLCIDGG